MSPVTPQAPNPPKPHRQISSSSVLSSTSTSLTASPAEPAFVHPSDSGFSSGAGKLGVPTQSGNPARFSSSTAGGTDDSDGGFDVSRSSSMTTITDQLHGGVHNHPEGQGQPQTQAQGQVQGLLPGQNVRCGGCKLVIDQSSGGVVVAFGNSLWHTACFRCAKCSTRVTADTNLLLLSDGSPVCSACSYQCFVCKNPITEEAIMTGDESYHAGCFTCRSCSKRIEELVFAKTSQGIYCMACHNERVARSRRHAEAKRNRAKREKEKAEAKSRSGTTGSSTPTSEKLPPTDLNGSTQSKESESSFAGSIASSSASQYSTDTLRNGYPSPSTTVNARQLSPSPAPSSPFLTPGPTPNSAAGGSVQQVMNGPLALAQNGTPGSHEKEKAYDSDKERDGYREKEREWQARREGSASPSPSQRSRASGRGTDRGDENITTPNLSSNGHGLSPALEFSPSTGSDSYASSLEGHGIGLGKAGVGLGMGPLNGLGVPVTSKADRRRSITPGSLWNQPQTDSPQAPSSTSTENSSGRMSPLPPSPLRASFTDTADFDSRSSSPTKHTGNGGQLGHKGGVNGISPRTNHADSLGTVDENSKMPSTQSSIGGPPRSSSLADASVGSSLPRSPMGTRALSVDRSGSPGPRKVDFGQRSLTSSGDVLNNRIAEEHSPNRDRSFSVGGEPPKLGTPPSLPSLNFSTSDTDFGSLLQEGKETSPTKLNVDGIPITPSTAGASSDSNGTLTPRSRMKTAADILEPLQKPFLRESRSASLPTSPVSASAVPAKPLPVLLDSPPSIVNPPKFSGDMMDAQSSKIPSFYRTASNDEDVFQSLSAISYDGRQESTESSQSLAVPQVDGPSSVLPVLQALLASHGSSAEPVSLKSNLLQSAIHELEGLHADVSVLRGKYTGAKRTSQHYIEGMSVAAEEYERETALRLAAEAEVNRLKAQVHDKTARLSLMAGDERRQETLQRRSKDLRNSLTGLEERVSKLRAEREIALAEVAELDIVKEDGDMKTAQTEEKTTQLARSLTNRLNGIKERYKDELEPLTAQRESLHREIAELRETRNLYLEESAALSAKNDELADLNSRLNRQAEIMQDSSNRHRPPPALLRGAANKQHISGSPSMSSLATTVTLNDNADDLMRQRVPGKYDPEANAPQKNKFKWYKSSKGPDTLGSSASLSKPLALPPDKARGRPSHESNREHIFQPHTILRFSKCEHCGDKMWGMQELRCAVCGIVCHQKCCDKLHNACNSSSIPALREESADDHPGSSIFGRGLIEQVKLDGQEVPVIVTKCIQAVEFQAMDYEGVYRKTGGSSLSKQITHLFDRGDYDSFNLNDMDKFNDINSITSVMKSYFRSLPDPLLTHGLHEAFVAAASNRDAEVKQSELTALVQRLPKEHYDTLRFLMLHLNRVKNHSPTNLMSSRNLGVVFGPTLMRSNDPSREFGDMAGKALSVEWLVDNAPRIFA